MPFYNLLKHKFPDAAERVRVIKNLERLREQLDAEIPEKDADRNLLLASWNIRDFGKIDRRGFGDREPETHFYIAEVLSRFDFIAVQEVNELEELDTVMSILGRDWDYIATDVTDTALGGNGERLTYCYDRRKLWFRKISGEIVLPPSMLISKAVIDGPDGEKLYSGKQFRRTPFVTSFQSGWFKFDICTVHLYYGAESGPQLEERVQEIGQIAKYFGSRAARAAKEGKALILLGDFNIVHPKHKTMEALLAGGFTVPKTLAKPTNFSGTKYYDQIAFVAKPEILEYIEKTSDIPRECNSGIVDLSKSIYRPEQWTEYKAQMLKSSTGKAKGEAGLEAYFKEWLTYQSSDHRPLWVRIKTNDAHDYLARLREKAGQG